jgi:hypothetical protein
VIFRAPSGVRYFRTLEDIHVERKKGHSTSKHQMLNSPLSYVLNEDQVLMLDWTVDGLPSSR